MIQPGRKYKAESDYRYGFNGKENDNEVKGEGNQQDYGMRIYDPRLGRFLSVDPLMRDYPELTSYQFASNTPIMAIDLDGEESKVVVTNHYFGKAGNTWSFTFSFISNDRKPVKGSHYEVHNNVVLEKDAQGKSTGNHLVTLVSDLLVPDVKPTEKKNDPTSSKNKPGNYNIEDAKSRLKVVYEKYGQEMAENVERIYRIETNHFKSKQYINTGTGGMEVFGSAPYYGWNNQFFEKNPQYKPTGVYSAFEGKGLSGVGGNAQVTDRTKKFVAMPSVEAGMMFKADYIERYNGNFARWFSKDTDKQEVYKKTISAIRPKIVEAIAAATKTN